MAESTATLNKTVHDLFIEELTVLHQVQRDLNSLTNHKKSDHPDAKATQKQHYRGAFVTVFVLWEAYARDVLEEGFIKLRDLMCKLSLDELLENVHRKELLEQALRKKGINQIRDDPRLWKEVLSEHMTKISPGFSPTFSVKATGADICGCFKKLFLIEENIPDKIANDATPITLRCLGDCPKDKKPSIQPVLTIKSAEALCCVSRLYYGACCIFAHGRKEPTLGKRGVLHEFPKTEGALGSILGEDTNYPVVSDLFYLYKSVKDQGRNASIRFYYIVNLERYMALVGSRLYNAIGKLVSDHYGVTIWDKVEESSFLQRRPAMAKEE